MAARRIVNDLPIADRLNAAAEGKYIAYDRTSGDYAMFSDRQYLGHAATYQVAETRIAEVYYEQLSHTAIETADLEALPFEPTQAELDECASPAVRVAPYICDDHNDENYGAMVGTYYRIGADDTQAEVYFPLEPTDTINVPHLYYGYSEGISLEDAFRYWRVLAANITAVLDAPEVQAAWARWQQQAGGSTIAAVFPPINATALSWQEGYEEGRRAGMREALHRMTDMLDTCKAA